MAGWVLNKKKSETRMTTSVLIFIMSHLLHIIVMPTVFEAQNTKATQLNQKQISGLALHLIFHNFSPLIVVQVLFCRLIKGIIPKICTLCFVLKQYSFEPFIRLGVKY